MRYRNDNSLTHGDIKECPSDKLEELAGGLRETIINTVSKNGGHLASNLGVVELTMALHRVFDFTKDKLIFDVGHQSYVHKLLSDRDRDFGTLRKKDGLSGFQVRGETKYDFFGGGHSGTSLSAAIGFAQANKLDNKENFAIAVIGDGSFTNGMIYEALNNASVKELKLIIILNDNEMSISQNVGGISKYFGKLRTSVKYYRFKRNFKRRVSNMKLFGRVVAGIGRGFKNLVKRLVYNPNYFENLGIDYMGPVDGHDIHKLEAIFSEAKLKNGATLIHVCTQKGKGYEYAEKAPSKYHSVGPFDRNVGIENPPAVRKSFTDVFGENIYWYATTRSDIVTVTAAMCEGTGLETFKRSFPDNFFDVGIAEEHAMTFAAGLAAAGKRPVIAMYSSFLQRCYDQLIHDVALQKLPVTVCVDHCGFVPCDGATHQGIFDCSFLMTIPNIQIYHAERTDDIESMLGIALKSPLPTIIRYPKGTEEIYDRSGFEYYDGYKKCVFNTHITTQCVCLITYGRLTKQLCETAKALSDICCVRVFCITRLKPLNTLSIITQCAGADLIYFVEEQIKTGGVGEILLSEMAQLSDTLPRFDITAIDNDFPKHATLNELYEQYGMTAHQIEAHVRTALSEISNARLQYDEV